MSLEQDYITLSHITVISLFPYLSRIKNVIKKNES
jgi:hypothetical protein